MREIKKVYNHKNKFILYDLTNGYIYEFNYKTDFDLQISTLKEEYEKVNLTKKSKYVYEVTYYGIRY